MAWIKYFWFLNVWGKNMDDPLWEIRGHIVKKNSGKIFGKIGILYFFVFYGVYYNIPLASC